MQFRETGNRVQCYAPWYDATSRRTRQKLVYAFTAGGHFQQPPQPDQLREGVGTADQRREWAADIRAEILERNKAFGAAAPGTLAMMLNTVSVAIMMQFEGFPIPFSARDMDRMRVSVRPLLRLLEIDVDEVNAKFKTKERKS
ncbi:hypothetical protein EHI42_08785 [Rhizobium hidalgonense]|uniref:hypothetical protein n=1 Tax=Rhizobium hidalgonense TaxID=1538159 RepID=UPI000FEC3F9F|nr:hypothetical protein [Rhizobium hidalgonense]RWX18298.1 hypothetical protein EHI42_08785 [Rhizobium hidalgonense]